jgi:hypothetical protein
LGCTRIRKEEVIHDHSLKVVLTQHARHCCADIWYVKNRRAKSMHHLHALLVGVIVLSALVKYRKKENSVRKDCIYLYLNPREHMARFMLVVAHRVSLAARKSLPLNGLVGHFENAPLLSHMHLVHRFWPAVNIRLFYIPQTQAAMTPFST